MALGALHSKVMRALPRTPPLRGANAPSRREWVSELSGQLSCAALSLNVRGLTVEFSSSSVELLTGHTPNELDGELLCQRLFNAAELARARAAVDRALKEGHSVLRTMFCHADGRRLQADVRLNLAGDAIEVTARMDQRDAASRRALIEGTPGPALFVDENELVVFTNSRVAQLGWNVAGLAGRPLSSFVASPGAPENVANEVLELALFPADGGTIVALRWAPFETRRSAQARMDRETFEKAQIGLAQIGLDKRYLAVNAKLAQITGYSSEELIGKSPLDFTPDDDAAVDRHMIDSMLSGVRASLLGEKRYVRKDGRLIWVRIASTLIRTHDGRPEFFVNAIEDIDSTRHFELAAREADKLHSLGRMAAGLAHDFNNLLAVILSYSGCLATDESLTEEQKADAHEVRSAAYRAAALTAQMLTYARKQPMQAHAVDCATALKAIEGLLLPLLGAQVTLTWDVEAGTPPCAVEPGQFEQVLVNLAINARDAMEGTGRLSIFARRTVLGAKQRTSLPHGEYVAIDVRDSGTGIAVGALHSIFEPFFTTKAEGKGTGLGLAIVRSIATQSGGTVFVADTGAGGTTFTILFPIATHGDAAVTTAAKPPVIVHSGQGEHLLVVDDDPAVRRMLHTALSRAGFLVTLASNGAEALFISSSSLHNFDALVSDIEMPLLNGLALMDRLREQNPSLPTLLMTGTAAVVRDDCHLLRKPFSVEELLQAISRILPTVTPIPGDGR